MISASDALQRLRDGNRHFVASLGTSEESLPIARSIDLPADQNPFAIVIGCSDARVPAEIVFDQGLGDLFVIRVAGNIASPSQIGSVEFAASRFGCRLVVVLGHSQCGAIRATIEELQRPAENQSRNLRAIVDRVKPAVVPLMSRNPPKDMETLMEYAVRANVSFTVAHLKHSSGVLEQLIDRDGLRIVGAEYSLETGNVDFFDADMT
ncbi:carbonic anhydrase [Candidatus Sumerlaeota bacterium]|nr:carbonic anhydrase [Candidatus Sumerlaeota bacterium]